MIYRILKLPQIKNSRRSDILLGLLEVFEGLGSGTEEREVTHLMGKLK